MKPERETYLLNRMKHAGEREELALHLRVIRAQLAAEQSAHTETKRELEAMTKAWNDGIEEQAKSLLRAETAERRLADATNEVVRECAKEMCRGCRLGFRVIEDLGDLLHYHQDGPRDSANRHCDAAKLRRRFPDAFREQAAAPVAPGPGVYEVEEFMRQSAAPVERKEDEG
jgi:hypothetical protein